jgi:putative membrane protein
MCGGILKRFERGENKRSHKWFRVFNELPVFLMLGIVLLVVVKPF